MKKNLFLIIVGSLSLLGTYASATGPDRVKKLYLDKQRVCVTKKGILLKTKKGFVRLKTLRSDTKGIYAYRKDFLVTKGDLDSCPCSGCGGTHQNECVRDACETFHDLQDIRDSQH